MSSDFQAIIDGIIRAGDQQIAAIEKSANIQLDEIRSKAESEANLQKERILKDAQVRLNRSRAIIEQKAVMQSLQLHANARQKLVLEVLEKIKIGLSKLRGSSEYKLILESFIHDALETVSPSLLDGQKIILHADKKDETVIRSLASSLDKSINIQYDLSCSGGCEAESEDGLIRALNTFESRFERALPLTQQKLYVYFEVKISSS